VENSSMKELKFIHAADLHLDSPMIGLSHLPNKLFERIKNSTFIALKNLTDAAIEHDVDFMIIAGDLFDEADRSVRAQTRLKMELQRLADHNIPVYVIHGNHDHLNGTWIHLEMPSNVHIFGEHVEVKTYKNSQVTAHLYGFSYNTRHTTENPTPLYVKKDGVDFHIGILHGHDEGTSEHGLYAPFRVRELVEKGFDYWALGHIHKRKILYKEPYIVYPGNIQGRHKKETGDKGCYLVHLSSIETRMNFISTSDVHWDHIELDVRDIQHFDELYTLCQKNIDSKRLDNKGVLLSMTLKNMSLDMKELNSVMNGELLQILQEEESEMESFVWLTELKVHQAVNWDRKQLERESEFYNELFRAADSTQDLFNSIKPLYEHSTAMRYLSSLSLQEKEQIQQDAIDMLIQLLVKE
jgi:DNA repair protein SbcD/Mre11